MEVNQKEASEHARMMKSTAELLKEKSAEVRTTHEQLERCNDQAQAYQTQLLSIQTGLTECRANSATDSLLKAENESLKLLLNKKSRLLFYFSILSLFCKIIK